MCNPFDSIRSVCCVMNVVVVDWNLPKKLNGFSKLMTMTNNDSHCR